jgi:hypothetical protein
MRDNMALCTTQTIRQCTLDAQIAQRRRDKLDRQAYRRRQQRAALGQSVGVCSRRLPAQPRPPKPPWYLTLNKEHVEPYKPTWGAPCTLCHSPLLSSEKNGWCCAQGKYKLPNLQQYPPAFDAFLRQNIQHIQPYARTLNNLFAFTAIGFSGKQHRYGNGPASVVITGRVYHRMLNLDTEDGSLKWFLFDEQAQGHHQAGTHQGVPEPFTTACKQLLEECSPYLRQLRHAIQTTGPNAFRIHLDRPVAGGDVAAIINPYNLHEIRGRRIVVSPIKGPVSDFIDILSPFYEPLQYPLLFPYGEDGWSRAASRTMTPRLTQSWWYRFRLLHEERFQQWGRLTCEYLVDMFSRIEEERLEYIRNGRQLQARDLFLDNEGDGTIEDDQDKELEQLFLGTLPSTFLGSRAWISENVANALAICRDLGNPSLFITMTTNPKWPEIVQRLLPGQTAADCPAIVCRAFKGRMDKLLQFFKSSRFGGIVYVVSVIEFQKRGLPHVHILIKVSFVFL